MRPMQMHLGTGSAHEHSDQQPDRSGAEHQCPVAGRDGRSLRRPQSVAARFDQGTEHCIDGVGKGVQRGDRYRQLLGQGAGTPPAYADLLPVLAHVLVTLPAAAAGAVSRAWCRP